MEFNDQEQTAYQKAVKPADEQPNLAALMDADGEAKLVKVEAASQLLATLPVETRAALALNSRTREVTLRELVQRSKDIVEVKNKAGRDQVHRMAMDLRTARTDIEKEGKAARADATAYSKAVITEQDRLIAITADEEARVFKLRDDYDAEEKRIADEAAKKESDRIEGHKTIIANMRALPLELVNASAEDIQTEIDAIDELSADGFPLLEEFGQQAVELAAQVRAQLVTMHAVAVAREESAAKLAAAAAAEAAKDAEIAALKAQLAALQPIATAPQEPEDPPRKYLDDDHALAGWESVEPDPSGVIDPAAGLAGAMAEAMPADAPSLARDMETIANVPEPEFSEAGLQRVAAAVVNSDTVQLRFEGFEDHTFGEYQHTGDDYQNAQDNPPIRWDVEANGERLRVVGQFDPEDGTWTVGVAGLIPEDWSVWMERGTYAYTPALVIDAPADVAIRCLERAA